MNPYKGLPDYQFWSRAVTRPRFTDIDPVVEGGFKIGLRDKVATIGSCFAQHVSQYVKRSGLNYFVAETGEEDTQAAGASRGFGVFSARYGNVYTVAQAVQLFDRAFGEFSSTDCIWFLGDRFVDAFRPQVEPNGFDTVEALKADRDNHLAAVRRVFSEANVIVFTLGLTEGWRSKNDAAIYPMAPGVAGGDFDRRRAEFVNYDIESVIFDLTGFIERIRSVNPSAKVMLTVSPVPLIATYEPRHVLISTSVSKSILRVAADKMVRTFRHVHYFPSFEVITAPGNNYYEPDLRQVSEFGVSHVMRLFGKYYIDAGPGRTATKPIIAPAEPIVCDEETIKKSLNSFSS